MFFEYPCNAPEVQEWLHPLRGGNHVMTRHEATTGAVRELFHGLEMQSILIVPILIGDSPWGCIGVDSCRTKREWEPLEIDLLKILANLIGTTIIRDRYVALLKDSEQKFRTVTEAALDALIVIDSEG